MLEIEAKVEFLTTAAGGRKGPVRNGYRGTIHVGDHYLTASFRFSEDRWIQPGETTGAEIALVSGEEFLSALPRSGRFEITEGPRIVGNGQVVRASANAGSSQLESVSRS